MKLAARVTVAPAEPIDAAASPPWESVRAEAYASTDIGPDSPVHYLHPSRQVSLDPAIRDYVRVSFPPGRPVFAGALELMRRLKDDFIYEPGATTVTTTPAADPVLSLPLTVEPSTVSEPFLEKIAPPASAPPLMADRCCSRK